MSGVRVAWIGLGNIGRVSPHYYTVNTYVTNTNSECLPLARA